MTGRAASSRHAMQQAKSALRKAILARRDAVDAARRSRDSRTITQKLCALPSYRAAKVVAAYVSFGSEFDTTEFVASILAESKQLLLPRINREQRVLELRHVVDPGTDLFPGVWGIREPAAYCPTVSAGLVDFILVPGVAFTTSGARLGYGGGFYDRLLLTLDERVARIAGAFHLQFVDQLPEGPQDQRVAQVITER
jgi:5-formyltetrahydrofolate cyclo-ligase